MDHHYFVIYIHFCGLILGSSTRLVGAQQLDNGGVSFVPWKPLLSPSSTAPPPTPSLLLVLHSFTRLVYFSYYFLCNRLIVSSPIVTNTHLGQVIYFLFFKLKSRPPLESHITLSGCLSIDTEPYLYELRFTFDERFK